MEVERRSFEIGRVVNLIEPRGWVETARTVVREKMSVSARKSLEGLAPGERRLALDELEMLITVFGWSVESSNIEETTATVTIVKELTPEVPE